MTVQLETLKENFIMTNEQIADLVTTWEVPDDLIEDIVDKFNAAKQKSPEIAKNLTMGEKLQFLVDQSFKSGILSALYIVNEWMKANFDEIEKDSDK